MATRTIAIASAIVVTWSCAGAHTPTLSGPAPTTQAVQPLAPAIERALESPAWPDELRAFYAAREWRPVFVGSRMADVPGLLDSIDALVADGLPPAPGTTQARRWLATAPDSDSLAALELLLAGLWVEAARGLTGGRLTPRDVDSLWSVEPAATDVWALLSAAERDGELAAALTALRPAHTAYARLREALARYRETAGNPGAPELERRLIVNLERWRWLPRRLAGPYLMANIPAFTLHVVDSGGAAAQSRVILGRSDWRTPLLHSRVTHVVLAPPWRVPAEIARREIFPQMRADSTYARRHGFLVYAGGATKPLDPAAIDWSVPDSVLDLRLVQQPGPSNPLGRVKLVFANQFSVALHDTPAGELFGNVERALSHGCIRVEGALELAARLVAGAHGWDLERMTSAAETWKTRWIAVPRPVPVYVTYFTAWVDDHGELQLYDDIYGWDAALARVLGL